MTVDEILSQNELEELAGCLVTSSGIQRYLLCLQTSRAVARLRNDAQQQSHVDLLELGWRCWKALLVEDERNEWEVPLAALVYILAHSGTKGVPELIASLAVAQRPQAAWISSLARLLLSQYRGGITFNNARRPLARQFRVTSGSVAHPVANLTSVLRVETSNSAARHDLPDVIVAA